MKVRKRKPASITRQKIKYSFLIFLGENVTVLWYCEAKDKKKKFGSI